MSLPFDSGFTSTVSPVGAGAWAVFLVVMLAGCGSGGGGNDSSNPDPEPATWQRSVENPLVTPQKSAAPATTYEISIADPSVLYDTSDGRWKAWYSATIFDTAIASDPGRIVIKYAESVDGVHWTVQATPALSARVAPSDWDYTHVETPSVVRNPDPAAPAGKRFMLFYAGGNTVADVANGRPIRSGYPYYGIGLAWSADGRSFTRDTPGVNNNPGLALSASMVIGGLSNYYDGLIADPEVLVVDGTIRLYCSSYAEDATRSPLAFGISHARSVDGHTWTLPTANPLASLYKAGELAGGEQPAVLYDAGRHRYEMWFKNDTATERLLIPTEWFTAYGFWRATSSDGITWTPDYSTRDFAWDSGRDYEAYGLLTGCSVVRHNGVDHLFYCAWGTRGIPDTTLYQVPLRSGSSVPAVITFAKATREVPVAAPHAIAKRNRGHAPALSAMTPVIPTPSR